MVDHRVPAYARRQPWRVLRGLVSCGLLLALMLVLPASLCSRCQEEVLRCGAVSFLSVCVVSNSSAHGAVPGFCSSPDGLLCDGVQNDCVPAKMGGPGGPHTVTFHMPYVRSRRSYPLVRLTVEIGSGGYEQGAETTFVTVTTLFDGEDTDCSATILPEPKGDQTMSLECDLPANVVDVELTVESDAPDAHCVEVEAHPPSGCRYTAEVCAV